MPIPAPAIASHLRLSIVRLAAGGVLLLLAAGPAAAVNMTMEATKSDGGAMRLCIGLDSTGLKVAGTQNDLIWDAKCANLKAGSCAAIPDSKKPLHGNTPPSLQSTYRALVFALDNVDPIRDGMLYCCDFEMTAPDPCCEVRFDRLGASDPVGNALDMVGVPPKLCLASGGEPKAGAAAPPAAPPAAAAPASEGGSSLLWIGLAVVAVVVVAALLMRGKKS